VGELHKNDITEFHHEKDLNESVYVKYLMNHLNSTPLALSVCDLKANSL